MNDLFQKLKTEVHSWTINKEPSFYRDNRAAMTLARDMFFTHPLVCRCREDVLPFLNDEFGHGLEHSKKVAIDAAALVSIECAAWNIDSCRNMSLCAALSGLIHDICRMEPDHALRGAEMTPLILQDYPLSDQNKAMIAFAIKNHEAFKPIAKPKDQAFAFLSSVLYDADKFRWGPDNFETTLWEICDYQEWSLDKIIRRFPKGMNVISAIKGTFRTKTGQVYGPEFIDIGLELGQRIFQRLNQLYLEQGSAEFVLNPQFNHR